MKRFLLILSLLPLLAWGQSPPDSTQVTPGTSFTPQWRYNGVNASDGINQFRNPLNNKWFSVYSTYQTKQLFAPVSASTFYIQNQNSSAQTANFWISGGGRIDGNLLLFNQANVYNSAMAFFGSNPATSPSIFINSGGIKIGTTGNLTNNYTEYTNNVIKIDNGTTLFYNYLQPKTGTVALLSDIVDNGITTKNSDGTNTSTGVKKIRFVNSSGIAVTTAVGDSVDVTLNSSFKKWKVTGQTSLVAAGEDSVSIVKGNGINLTTDNTTGDKKLTISADTATSDGLHKNKNLYDVPSKSTALLNLGVNVNTSQIPYGGGSNSLVSNANLTYNGTLTTRKSTSAQESPTYGADLAAGATWTSTGWTGSFGAGFTHTAGNTTALSANITPSVGVLYEIKLTLSGYTGGNAILTFGGTSDTKGMIINGDIYYAPLTINANQLVITPTTGFVGTISGISVRQITAPYTPIHQVYDSGGNVRDEVYSSTLAKKNFFQGLNAGRYNGGGYENYFSGYDVGKFNTSGFQNVGIGVQALEFNTQGHNLTGVGFWTLRRNTTGRNNDAFGTYALSTNTIGEFNVAIGTHALNDNVAGVSNTGVGVSVMQSNITGSYHTAVGNLALFGITGSFFDVAVGYQALTKATSEGNAGIGSQGLLDLVGGSGYNTSLGTQAGRGLVSGSWNTFLGATNAATGITTGSNNVLVGSKITGLSTTLSNTMYFADGSGNARFTIPSTGNFIIGNGLTDDATNKLQVNGAAIATSLKSSGFSGSKVLVSSGTTVAESAVTTTTLGYLDASSSIQTQLNAKQATLVSGTTIKTINGNSILGSGDIAVATNPMTTAGDIIYGGASGTPTRLASNSSATRKFLTTVSSGNPTYFDLFNTTNTFVAQQTFSDRIKAQADILFEGTFSTVLTTGVISADNTVTLPSETGTLSLVRLSATTTSNTSLVVGRDYSFNGTTATFTLPAKNTDYIGGTYQITIKNRGSGNLTINSNSGGNDIYTTSAVNTDTITPGTSVIYIQDSDYWVHQ